MKYIMFARQYPAWHRRAGEATGFREAILSGRKRSTLRAGAGGLLNGDEVSLREWEGVPYRSRQIEFARCVVVVEPFTIAGTLDECPRLRHVASIDGFADADDFVCWLTRGVGGRIEFAGSRIWLTGVDRSRQMAGEVV